MSGLRNASRRPDSFGTRFRKDVPVANGADASDIVLSCNGLAEK